MGKDPSAHLEGLAKTLAAAVIEVFKEKAPNIDLGQPTYTKQQINEYESRMRVSALDKFNTSGYTAYVAYYRSKNDQEKKQASGAIVMYLLNLEVEPFLKKFGFQVEEDEEKEVAEACAELCNLLADRFLGKISIEGYNNFVMSAPASYRQDVPGGVPFSFEQTDKYEVSFKMQNIKKLVFDLTLSPSK